MDGHKEKVGVPMSSRDCGRQPEGRCSSRDSGTDCDLPWMCLFVKNHGNTQGWRDSHPLGRQQDSS